MVHSRRTAAPPAELAKHGKRWAARFQANREGEWATLKAKKVLSAALRSLAHGKCVYCESALEVTAYLAIEHYVAKTIAPELAFEWINLLPACQMCNTAKGEQDHKNALLKADAEDPEPYFWIHPDTGKLEPHPKLDNKRAHRANETIRLCNLQRAALCSKRVEMLERVGRWLELASGGKHLATLRAEWESLTNPGAEYKFVLRHMLEIRGQHELAEIDRARFVAIHTSTL